MENYFFKIPVIANGEVNPIFIRGTALLLKQFPQEFATLSSHKLKKNKLKELWKNIYFADIIEDNNMWNYILFKNEHHQTIFLLKSSIS